MTASARSWAPRASACSPRSTSGAPCTTRWPKVEDYVILGACNPALAHRALQVDPSIGLLLPCPVVVRAVGARTAVEYVDPHAMIALTRLADLEPVAEEAAAGLRAALQALHQPALQAGDDASRG